MLKRSLAILVAGLMLLTAVPMVSADSIYNDGNLGWDDHTTHTYDDCGDVSCNICGALRQSSHVYDHACDTDCNNCGAVRETQHVYDNACDAICNVVGCGHVRTVGDHVYDHACDTDCNICDAVRETQHVYDNACDTTCNVVGCGHIRTAGDHVWKSGSCAYCGEASPSTVIIVTQPAIATYAKEGAKATVTVKATGDGLKYQWYYRNAGYTKYSKSSVTTATYSVTMSEKSHDRRLYCVITDKYGNQVRTDTVLVRRQATITKESSTANYAKMGATVKASVTAVGEGLTYTWYYRNEGKTTYSKSSVTKPTYSATMSDKVKNRRVYCIVKDKYGKTVQSKTFLLRESVSITTQLKTPYAKLNAKASVTVKASGDGLTYTWYYKNAGKTAYSKSSVTSATYSTTMTSTSKNRMVYCVVKDKYGNTVQTNKVTLREAASIVTQPKATTVAKNKTASVTVKASGDGLKYTWYYKNTGATKYGKSSVTKATYSVTMTSKVNGRLLYCIVTDKYGNTVKTVTVKLKMQ